MKRLDCLFSIVVIMLLVPVLIASSSWATDITIRARGTSGTEKISLSVSGSGLKVWTVTTSFADYNAPTTYFGDCKVRYTGTDTSNTDGKDVQIDYIIVDGNIRQAEDQADNTGVWQNNQCGGSHSEWLNCSGYIDFGNVGVVLTLSVSTTSLTVSAEASSTGTFDINSNTTWTVSSNQTWLTPSPTSGSNNATITCTALQNDTGASRTAVVTVSGTGVAQKTVTVTQGPILGVSPTSLSLGAAENSSGTFDISSSRNWSVSSDQNWLTVDPNSGSNNATVTVIAQQNNTGAARIATVTVSTSGVTPLTVTVGQSGSVNSSYEIGKWSGFRTAAVTYTFDDGSMPGLYNTAIPMFNEPNFNYKLTAYPVINWCGSYWSNLIAAAAVGHEVGDHSVTHDGSWCSWTASQQGAEYASSQSTINANIPGNQCITVAYPYCCTADYSTPATYFIAARICGGTVNPGTPSNFYAIDSIILGNQGINTTAGITQKDDQAASGGGWVVYLIHALDSDSGYSPLSSTILRESLNYLAAHRSTFWVSTFSNVVRYIKERDSALVFETSNTGDIISVLVTDTLDNTIYNYPITIRRPLPTGWTSAVVKQNGSEVNSSIVTIGPTQYVMFDVVPDGGDVMLTRAYGDFDTSGAVNLTDLDSFFDVWLNMDCGATTGIDLDGDCTVDFYEFAVFANNWLTVQ